MNLFDGIGFENFRVFNKKEYFNLAPITIITGTNNSGKSTLLNGIKLLKENFKNIKSPDQQVKKLDLEALLNTVIDSGSLLENYGTIKQFVCKDGKANVFNFSFQRKMAQINDEVDITFTIKLNNNQIGDAIVKKISMRSLNSRKNIFQIERTEDPDAKFKMSCDFVFFFDAINQRIDLSKDFYIERNCLSKQLGKLNQDPAEQLIGVKALQAFNKKHNTHYYIDGYHLLDHDKHGVSYKPYIEPFYLGYDLLQSIISEKDHSTGFYDFSFLWASEHEKKVAFDAILTSYYGKSDNEIYSSLNDDIFKFLSDIKWFLPFEGDMVRADGINFILNKSEYTLGIGLKKFTELFTNFSRHPNFGPSILTSPNKSLEIYEDNFRLAYDKHERFYEKVLKPLMIKIAELKGLEKGNNISDKLIPTNGFTVFDKLLPTGVEKLFSKLIMDNLYIIQTCIAGLHHFNFLSKSKIQNKRTYSLADGDEFTLMIKKLEGMEPEHRKKAYEFIDKWLKEFDIADSFIIKRDKDTANFKPYLKKGNNEILMADFGYGTSQILPILLKIIPDINEDFEKLDPAMDDVPKYHSRIIVLEEPEANLHPALQSKLADLFVESSKIFNIQLLIETHSEYLIRKLQYLTASPKSNLKPNDTIIYYFFHPDRIPPGEKQVKEINIQHDGILTNDFGTGFFDESDKIAMSIWSMNKSQKN